MPNKLISWNELKKYRTDLDICRTDEVTKKYEIHKKTVKDVNKHILEQYFSNNESYNLTINLFPYALNDNINHQLLWISPNSNVDIDSLLLELIPDKELIYWMNKPENQSVKLVPHYHVFTLLD